MENNNKTQAELYREERKERLAKEAAKKAKRSPKSIKAAKTVKKVIAIALAVVIAFGAVAGVLNFFDVPQKVVKISIDGIESKISLAEINYFYFQTWSQSYSNTVQYEYYGMSTGFDYTLTPDQQAYTEEHVDYAGITLEELGVEEPTWQDVFTYSAVTQLVYIKYGAEKAREAGLEITETEASQIEDQFTEIKATAEENDYSLNRWLRLQLGYGVTEKMIRNIMEESYLAEQYYEKITDEAMAAVTDEEIAAEYEANRADYDIVTLRVYEFAAEMGEHTHDDSEEHAHQHEEAEAEAKAKADAFIAKVEDEESFIKAADVEIFSEDEDSTTDPDESTLVEDASYSSLASSYDEAVAEWAMAEGRKAGDYAAVEGSGASYAVYAVTAPAKDTTIYSSDVRHILIKFPETNTDGTEITTSTDENGASTSTITEETKAATKAEAQKVLDEYLKNPTEENFIELTKKYTGDVDADGNPNYNGLYEDVTSDSGYVESFKNWALDSSHKVGDTEIVETEYGYHIMYYAKSNGTNWETTIRTAISGVEIEENVANVIDAAAKAIDIDSFFINWTLKRENEHIATIIVNNL